MAEGRGGEFADALLPHALERFVFQKTGAAERFDEMFFELTDLDLAGGMHEAGAEIEFRLLAIEAGER